MFEQDSMVSPQPPAPVRRRWAWLWVVLIVAGGIGGLIAWGAGTRPKAYRQVARFPIYQGPGDEMLLGYGILPCTDGFCLREEEFVFTLREWTKGQERWRVTIPTPRAMTVPGGPGRPTIDWAPEEPYAVSASPDGHLFAAAVAAGDRLRVQSWRDGASLGEVTIPLRPLAPKAARAMNIQQILITASPDARCYVTLNIASIGLRPIPLCAAFAIDGNRLLGRYQGKAPPTFAPDGSVALLYDELSTISVKDGQLRFTPKVTVGSDTPYPCAGGTALSINGIVYRLAGKPTVQAGAWEVDTVTTDGRYAILYNEHTTRAVATATGDAWEIPVKAYNRGGDATMDGRHILSAFTADAGGVVGLLEQVLPGLVSEREFIALYERPGRLRAWMRTDPINANSWWPSPDGRSVAFTADECLLYRY